MEPPDVSTHDHFNAKQVTMTDINKFCGTKPQQTVKRFRNSCDTLHIG